MNESPHPMTNREGLKPCPFCGDSDEKARIDKTFMTDPPTKTVVIRCRVCEGSAPITIWNTRTPDHAAQVEALEAEVARLTAPQDVDLCELARQLEKVNEEKVIAEVEALTNGRTDPYLAGFSQACEEIAHRLGVPFKESTPESPT